MEKKDKVHTIEPKVIWASSRQNQQNDSAPSEYLDQPGHEESLRP